MNDVETKNMTLLTRALVTLASPDEALAFLLELCTPQEARMMAQRMGIAELLIQGIPQVTITEMMCSGDGSSKPSTATIARVNGVVKNGEGHLRNIILRISDAQGC